MAARPSASLRRSTADGTSAMPVDIAALWKAAKKHDAPRVKQLLLQANAVTGSLAIINQFHPKKGTTPLMIACKKRDKSYRHPLRSGADTVQTLLEFGADMEMQESGGEGHTALHYAAISNHVRAVEFMLHTGVSAYVLNRNGHAAIDLARWHRSRDVLDVLTQHSRILQGYLFVKKMSHESSVLNVWKKRWAVALACDAERNVVELSLFRDRDDVRPQHVILLKPDTHTMVASPKKKWLDRHNMFHVDRAVVVLKSNIKRRFSRDETMNQRSSMGGETVRMQFASETALDRDAWMAILLRRRLPPPTREPITSGGLSLMSVPEEFMRWPSPVAINVVPFEEGQPSVASPQYNLFGHTDDQSASHASSTVSPRGASPSAPSFIGSVDGYDNGTPLFYEQVTPPAEPPSATDNTQRSECTICMDAPRDAICAPCGHVAGCYPCLFRQVTTLHQCPICRANAHSVIKIYEC